MAFRGKLVRTCGDRRCPDRHPARGKRPGTRLQPARGQPRALPRPGRRPGQGRAGGCRSSAPAVGPFETGANARRRGPLAPRRTVNAHPREPSPTGSAAALEPRRSSGRRARPPEAPRRLPAALPAGRSRRPQHNSRHGAPRPGPGPCPAALPGMPRAGAGAPVRPLRKRKMA